jgi:DNA-binding NarL/FixJ family response regulator
VAIRILLVDDHEVLRRGIADLMEHEDDLEIVGETASAAEVLARAPQVWPARPASSSSRYSAAT